MDLAGKLAEPGRYAVFLARVYVSDGGEHGLDAWTGSVFSNTIEIQVK